MNPQIPQYPFGLPATGFISIAKVPSNTPTVSIAGTTYTFGTNFTGPTVSAIARNLAALINSDTAFQGEHSNTQPVSSVAAVWYGGSEHSPAYVRIVATSPGTDGNAITLSTNDTAGAFVVSGGTLSGGTDKSVIISSGAGASSDKVQGADATGAVPTGNPVLIAGTDGSNDVAIPIIGTGGAWRVEGVVADNVADAARPVKVGGRVVNPDSLPSDSVVGRVVDFVFSLKRHLLVHLATTLDSINDSVSVFPGKPVAAALNNGYLTHTATTAAATLLTVPAGKIWAGTVTVICALSKAAAATGNGSANALIATAGTGVTPTAGTVLECDAKAGANAATGVVGTQGQTTISSRLIVIAPVGNSVTLTLASTIANATEGKVSAMAVGENW